MQTSTLKGELNDLIRTVLIRSEELVTPADIDDLLRRRPQYVVTQVLRKLVSRNLSPIVMLNEVLTLKDRFAVKRLDLTGPERCLYVILSQLLFEDSQWMTAERLRALYGTTTSEKTELLKKIRHARSYGAGLSSIRRLVDEAGPSCLEKIFQQRRAEHLVSCWTDTIESLLPPGSISVDSLRGNICHMKSYPSDLNVSINPCKEISLKERSMTAINVSTLRALANIEAKDEFTHLDRVPTELADVIRGKIADRRKARMEEAADQVVKILEVTDHRVKDAVGLIREARARERAMKELISRIEAALDHGNATQNYLPLCAVLGLIPHGEDTELPEKKAPKAAKAK